MLHLQDGMDMYSTLATWERIGKGDAKFMRKPWEVGAKWYLTKKGKHYLKGYNEQKLKMLLEDKIND